MTVTTPKGFTAAGVAAGLKSSGGKDVSLVVNDGPTHDSATVFTANRCKANPVLWSQEVVKDGVGLAAVGREHGRGVVGRAVVDDQGDVLAAAGLEAGDDAGRTEAGGGGDGHVSVSSWVAWRGRRR